jgi:hypothetical protein
MDFLRELKKWICGLTEIVLLLVALCVVLEILFGHVVPFFGGIIANLTGLIRQLGENGLVGLIAACIIFLLFYRQARLVPAESSQPGITQAAKGTGSNKRARKRR